MEPKWLTAQLVQAIHTQAVAEFGGSHGVRDMGLLESALDRPRNLYAYGDDPTLFDLAAAYCTGIVKNHPFIDGNKRTGDLTARAFLFRNGYLFEPDEIDEVNMIVALAAGEIEENVLARWISDNSTAMGA
ncbi:MAG: type II toxin-antitoxin system death-on-curing family toxin [Proteobacteria bacterium]|nr:type II toxin-antitoxin system death-on-curing family toxin [Pseudomonadota bacterium]MCH8809949.1 type II toxin-antitoxin system death-on-curing family toxin [Pseudomonadota bacterium]